MSRAHYKRALEELYAERAHDVPVHLDSRIADPAPLLYRAVELTGRFDGAHTFLLDNRVQQGRVGYEVYSPLQVRPDLWVLVDRGWVAASEDRRELPRIETPQTMVELRGIIGLPPGKTLILGEQEAPGWPKVIERVDMGRLSQQLGRELQSVVILLDPASPHGFAREWQVTPVGAQRHLAYAFQWFSLAAVLLIVYLVVNTRRVT